MHVINIYNISITNLEFYDGYRAYDVGEELLRRDRRSKHRQKRRLRHGFDVMQPDILDGADESLIRVELEFVKVVHFLADDEFAAGAKLLTPHRSLIGKENQLPIDIEILRISFPSPTHGNPF